MGATAVRSKIEYPVAWEPQHGPQTSLITCPIWDIFFGGARGGGKTDGMLGDFLDHAMTYGERANGVFFRRTAKQLEEVIERSKDIYPKMGGVWLKGDATWVFLSGPAKGARLKFRHLWDEKIADDYLGHAYTWICCEELTNWPYPAPIDKIMGTLRSAHGVPVCFRATGNPGGPGHGWVKARYIDPAPKGFAVITDPETGLQRTFIPSKLEDNPLLFVNDPLYEARLRKTGPDYLVKAWRFGIWDIVAGGFFDDIWRPDKHIIKPFAIPLTWRRCRSFDWGSSSPSSTGFWACSDGTQPKNVNTIFPRGSLIRTGEWYTVKKDDKNLAKPNVGLRLNNTQLGKGIADRSKGLNWSGCVADPSIFTESGGDSIYKQVQKGALEKGYNLILGPADNSRIPGWQKMRSMLEESANDFPENAGLWITENCLDWIRTVPILQRDSRDGDDVDTESEDHAADETRYICNTKPKIAGTMELRGF